MSHGHFHVHGPDQHELEYQAAHGDNLAVRVSIMTAILATFGAVFSDVGSSQLTTAADCKNDAILAKNEAITTDAAAKARYAAEIARYKAEKAEIKMVAEGLERRADASDAKVDPRVRKSVALMHPHHVLAQAITLLQIGVALASICVLTKVRARFWASAGASLAGLLLAIGSGIPHGDHPAEPAAPAGHAAPAGEAGK
jgi:hypothetical protein